MDCIRLIAPEIWWVGCSDRRLALFENLFPLPDGVSYNSYLIADEKTALIDTVDEAVSRQFIDNVRAALDGRTLDYLIINHMEPDHCANIDVLMDLYPEMMVVGNTKTFEFFNQFYQKSLDGRTIEIQEGSVLSLGKHSLQFIAAPMVHWPEVTMCYEPAEKILFSADAFGSFGAYTGSNLFSDHACMICGRMDEVYLQEARRYYTNIVGKYGPQVQAVLKKAVGLDIQMIASLHGPIWRRDLEMILERYEHWSRYIPEEKGVMIAYGSMYGNTEEAALILANQLADKGVTDIVVHDISKTHASYLIADAFKYSHWAFAAPTYNMGLYYPMNSLLHELAALNLQNRDVAVIGNGSWAPVSHKLMTEALGKMKDIRLIDEPIVLRSALKKEQVAALEQLASRMVASISVTDIAL